jgi:predicted transcriptional regulator
MKRVTVSLSDEVAKRAEAVATEIANGNVSLIAEVALKKFLDEPFEERHRYIYAEALERTARSMAATRSGWMRAFWRVLCELMRVPLYDPERVYGPRHFGNLQVVLLLSHFDRPDDEDDPFTPYIAPVPATSESPSPWQKDFVRSSSPVDAANVVAAKLRDFGFQPRTPTTSAHET